MGVESAELTRETVRAWDEYVAAAEARIERQLSNRERFLGIDSLGTGRAADARRRVLAGEVLLDSADLPRGASPRAEMRGGMIHHWRGTILIPGAALDPLLTRLQHPNERGPHQDEVVAMRVLERRPDHLKLFIRMAKNSVVRVTFDTVHDVRYRRYGDGRASSRSIATKIVEVADAGTPAEHEKPAGQDHGFMWRLNSYWRYEQTPAGVIVECESLTLSRDIPFGLSFLVRPIIDSVARDSIRRTLVRMRDTGPEG